MFALSDNDILQYVLPISSVASFSLALAAPVDNGGAAAAAL